MITNMIIIELPHTDGPEYMNTLDMYLEWLHENNIAYNFKHITLVGFNDKIEIGEADAILFRLKFGL